MKNNNTNASLRLLVAIAAFTLALVGCGGGGATGGTGGTGGTAGIPPLTYTIGGTLTGLAAGQSIVLQDNGGDNLTVSANGTFTFATGVATNSTYNATVLTQPTNGQVCKVANGGSGTVSNINVTTITVDCSSSISGYLVGLASGQSVVLQDNGGDDLTINANGAFTFATPLFAPSTYNVTVRTQPANGQACSVMPNSSTSGSSGVGTVSTASITTVRISCASVFTYAGSGVAGEGDATGGEAAFTSPSGTAFDAAGNLYVLDSTTNVVRKISPVGVVTTLAKLTPPPATYTPVGTNMSGVAVDASGNVYVADAPNNVIWKITSTGTVSTFAGSGTVGYVDATGTAAVFNSPQGLAIDSAGNLYVGDAGNNMIRKITPGAVVSTLAGSTTGGYVDATGTAARFSNPTGVAVDASGNVYVADFRNNVIRKITSAGVVTTLAGNPVLQSGVFLMDGTGTAALFYWPTGVAVDGTGNVYVNDSNNQAVRMITPSGVVSTVAGLPWNSSVYSDGPSTVAKFMYGAQGISVDGSGNVYVADLGNNRIRKVSAKPYSYTIGGHLVGLAKGASLTLQNNAGDNLSLSANGAFTFATPQTDISGAQSYNVTISTQPAGQTCSVINGTGGFTTGDVLTVQVNCAWVSTFAGSVTSGSTDGLGTTASFYQPNGLVVDSSGNVYVADAFNNKIRKITPQGVVSTFAGSGLGGSLVDGTGTSASFSMPQGLAIDSLNNLYVADTGNCAIRKITQAGVVTTLAGQINCGYKDATTSAAMFDYPTGVAVDSSGNVYVADMYNYRIRMVTQAGVVTTLAGGAQGTLNGIGTAAQFIRTTGIAIDPSGTLYVADYNTIRKITSGAVVTTWVGGSTQFALQDGVGTGSGFWGPGSLAVDASGNVYVADVGNNAIRVVTPTGSVSTIAGTGSTGYGTITDGNGGVSTFSAPFGVAVDPTTGNLYVGDTSNNAIRKIVP